MARFRLHGRAAFKGVLGCLLLGGLVLVGSRRLQFFDSALIAYLFSALFATFGVIYRYSVWRDRPPTETLWKRSLSFFKGPGIFQNTKFLVVSFFAFIVRQRFIQKRSFYQWLMHFTLSFGTALAFAITFPLVFGWLHFETVSQDQLLYRLYAFGFPTFTFSPHGLAGFVFFNVLNLTAILVLIGIAMAIWRRIQNRGLQSVQNFAVDFLPLLILFSVAITGLLLTYSTHLLQGGHFVLFSALHCFTVVLFLIYLPFGKLFHIFQRPAQIGAAFYIREKKEGEGAPCLSCGDAYTSKIQKEDVKLILSRLGFSYSAGDCGVQDLCPPCRRKMVMAAQERRVLV